MISVDIKPKPDCYQSFSVAVEFVFNLRDNRNADKVSEGIDEIHNHTAGMGGIDGSSP